jgi:uncharacterized protein YecT (DUF1311 family)
MADGTGDFKRVTYLEPPDGDVGSNRPFQGRLARSVIVASMAAALGISVGFGALALRNLRDQQARDLAAAESLVVPVEIAAPQPSPAPPPAAAPLDVLPPEAAPAAAPAATAPVRPAAAPAPRADPDFDCRRPNSQSERLVCGDAELARLDRNMNRAFDAAVAAGAPYESLRQDQDNWLAVREDAARNEPDGVAGMYRQRIAELRDIAANF